MRITTQMLAHSAAKSGIPFQQTTLLDILNKKSSFSGLLNGVNASADATAIAKKKNYSKLEDISGNLNGYASSLVATDKNSIYDRAKESVSTKDIVSSAKKMVESYNATLKQLRETGDTLNEFYRQQLKDIPAGDKEALKSIGITQAKDGSLSIDEKVLQCRCRHVKESVGWRYRACFQDQFCERKNQPERSVQCCEHIEPVYIERLFIAECT